MNQPGEQVGDYRLDRQLGEGPFGVVWLAHDERAAPLVLKLLRVSFIQRPAGQAAFTRLIASSRVSERLQHPNLCRVYGVVQDPRVEAYGLALEYLDGRSLGNVKLPPGALDVRESRALIVLLEWFEQLGDLLSWLHSRGVIHGNLKPTNVLLLRREAGYDVKLLDLPWSAIGMAAPQSGARSYLAPEQLQGNAPTGASDQWSLASMLSGILSGSADDASGDLPPSLTQALRRAAHPDPAARFSSVAEFVDVLSNIRLLLESSIAPTASSADMLRVSGVGPVPMRFDDEPTLSARTLPAPPTPPGQATSSTSVAPQSAVPIHQVAHISQSAPVVPSSRRLNALMADTGDFQRPAQDDKFRRHEIGDVLEPGDTIAPGVMDPPMTREPELGFDSVSIPDERAEASTPPPPASAPKSRGRSLAIYGGIAMFVAGAVVVTALKMAGVSLAGRPDFEGPAAAKPPDAGVMSFEKRLEQAIEKDLAQDRDTSKPHQGTNVKLAPVRIEVDEQPEPPPPKSVRDKARGEDNPTPSKRGRRSRSSADPADPSNSGGPELDMALAKLEQLGPEAIAFDVPSDASAPKEAFAACKSGDGPACIRVGDYHRQQGAVAKARVSYERACDQSQSAGCYQAAQLWVKESGGLARGLRLFERACNQMIAEGCREASDLVRAGRGATADPSRADLLRRKACTLGHRDSCDSAAPAPVFEKLDDEDDAAADAVDTAEE